MNLSFVGPETVFETLRSECSDCGAPLQECPSWAERKDQSVYRCPWVTETRLRVEHASDELLIFNCNWPKGVIARRIGAGIQ